MNVSGIVVKTRPEHLQEVIDNINALEKCEVHFSDNEGKIVVTVEGESISDQMETMKMIQGQQFVLSADLSFSYCEDELMRSLEEMKGQKHSCSLD